MGDVRSRRRGRYGIVLAFVLLVVASVDAAPPRSLDQAAAELKAAAERPWIELLTIGRSAGDRPLVAARLGTDPEAALWRLLFIGSQHGDEPAGAEALLDLVAKVAADSALVPADTAVWVVPIANPDGVVLRQRSNAAGADLNRDHLTLDQPETRAIHELVRAVDPHVVVDCHEFTRDSADFADRGWGEWPLVTMDTVNHPLLPDAFYRLGLLWMRAVEGGMADAGFAFRRYLVGGVPPEEELRPSTLDADDARNGLALDGRLGFIIESGVKRSAEDPDADLDRRAAAQLALLERFIGAVGLRHATLATVRDARAAKPPAFVPTNVLWGRTASAEPRFKVIRLADGSERWLPAPLLMEERVIKDVAATPNAYFVEPAAAAPYRELLTRHAIPFVELEKAQSYVVESCRLERLEEEYDPVYERYGGRQIVSCSQAARRELPAGSLLVAVTGERWRRTVALLEPRELFGLYQFPRFRDELPDSGALPVVRVPLTR